MAFDSDAYAEAVKPWRVKLGGIWFVAQLWSANQSRELATGWGSLQTEEERRALWSGVLARLFPFRLSYWWLGNPRKMFWKLTPQQQSDAIRDFFEYLARNYAPARKTGATRKAGSPPTSADIVVAHAFRSPGRSRTSKPTTLDSSSTKPGGERAMATSQRIFAGGTGE